MRDSPFMKMVLDRAHKNAANGGFSYETLVVKRESIVGRNAEGIGYVGEIFADNKRDVSAIKCPSDDFLNFVKTGIENGN